MTTEDTADQLEVIRESLNQLQRFIEASKNEIGAYAAIQDVRAIRQAIGAIGMDADPEWRGPWPE